MTNYVNADGLLVRFGTTQATLATGGTLPYAGPYQITEHRITATALTTTPVITDYNIRYAAGDRIVQVDVISETACTSGGSATLNIGLKKASDFSTELDHDGLVAALALASINANGEFNELRPGSTSVGALVGTVLTEAGVLVASYATAAFTAGTLIIRVYTTNQ